MLKIYNSFVRPHMYYGDVFYRFYNQPRNEPFCGRLESTEHNAPLGITGAIRDLPVKKYTKN